MRGSIAIRTGAAYATIVALAAGVAFVVGWSTL
jgi:hypothetical protein